MIRLKKNLVQPIVYNFYMARGSGTDPSSILYGDTPKRSQAKVMVPQLSADAIQGSITIEEAVRIMDESRTGEISLSCQTDDLLPLVGAIAYAQILDQNADQWHQYFEGEELPSSEMVQKALPAGLRFASADESVDGPIEDFDSTANFFGVSIQTPQHLEELRAVLIELSNIGITIEDVGYN